MVLDARNLVAISGGVRERPVDALATVQDPFIVTGVRLPAREGWRSDFVKFAWRRASGKTIVNVSAALRLMNGLLLKLEWRSAATREAGFANQPGRWRAHGSIQKEIADQAAAAAVDEMTWSVDAPVSETYGRRCVAHGIGQLLTVLR